MADKDARVRLNLAAAGFLSSMQGLVKQSEALASAVEEIGGESEKTSRKASGFFTVMKAGASGARSAVGELVGHLKQAVMMGATLGGALSIGGAIHSAMAATKSYKDLAFAVRVGTGEAVGWQDVQRDIESGADRWKVRIDGVKGAYESVFQETGNMKFSAAAADSVAMAHVATGKSMETLGSIAGLLNDKFGITEAGLNDTLAAAIELGNKGGVSLEDLGGQLGELGAVAKTAGLTGEGGFRKMVGMLNIADGPMKNIKQSLRGLNSLFTDLADPDRAKAMEKALGIKLTDKDGSVRGDALERVLAKTRGKQSELAKVFSGQELRLVTDLGKSFAKTFEETKGDVQTKTAAALEAYRASIDQAAKVGFTGADLQKEAGARLGDQQRSMDQALNDFQKVFERPEMVRAVDQLAGAAPKLAKLMGGLVSYATEHPALAATGVVGAVAAKGALAGAGEKIGESIIGAAGEFAKKAFGRSVATSAGETFAGAAFSPSWGAVFGGAFALAAAAGLAMAIGNAVQDHIESADAARRKSKAEALRASLTDEFQRTGTRRKLTEAERLTLAEGGLPGEEAPTGTDLARARERFGSSQEGRAALEAMGVDLGSSGPDFQVTEIAAQKMRDAGILPKAAEGQGAKVFVPKMGLTALPEGVSADAKRIASDVTRGEQGKVTITNEQAIAAAVARQLGAATLNVRILGGGTGTNGLPPAVGNGSGSAPR